MLARRPPPANTLCHTTLGPASRPVPAPGSSTGESRPSVPPAFHAGPASDKQAQAALSPTAAPAPSPPASALQSSSKKEPPTPRDPKAWQLQGTPKAWEGNHPPEDCAELRGACPLWRPAHGPRSPQVHPAEPTWLGQRHEPWGVAARGPQGAVEEAGVRLGPSAAGAGEGSRGQALAGGPSAHWERPWSQSPHPAWEPLARLGTPRGHEDGRSGPGCRNSQDRASLGPTAPNQRVPRPFSVPDAPDAPPCSEGGRDGSRASHGPGPRLCSLHLGGGGREGSAWPRRGIWPALRAPGRQCAAKRGCPSPHPAWALRTAGGGVAGPLVGSRP